MEKTRDYLLPASVLVAALVIAGAVLYASTAKNGGTSGKNAGQANVGGAVATAPSINAGDVLLGDPKAPVTMIEFGDYQCPFCGKFFSQTEPLLRKNYIETGKVKIVYKDFAFLGPESFAAANAAECAKDQGKFWEYHDALFAAENKDGKENNGNLNETLFASIAKDLGMDVNAFNACYKSKKYDKVVKEDIQEGNAAMDRASTPTFFINGRMIQGALPYQAFAQLIDTLLGAKK